MLRRSAVILMLVLQPSWIAAQDFWIKKNFDQWSLKECLRLLQDSPWTQSKTFTRVFIQSSAQAAAVPGREDTPQITYAAQIWSAAPIRQAAVQKTRLSKEYKNFDAQKRQELEANAASLLKDTFSDRIEIRVEYSTTAPIYEQSLAAYWQNRANALWPQDTFLITPTGKHPPAQARSEGLAGYFVLVFPRTVDGRPLISAADKGFSLDFYSPAVGVMPSEHILLEFKLKNMTIQGVPIF
jgi:hypothetical protein